MLKQKASQASDKKTKKKERIIKEDKMMSKGKMELIKNIIKENVEAKGDKEIPIVNTDDENLKFKSGIVVRNAFDMLKSIPRGQISPLRPVMDGKEK